MPATEKLGDYNPGVDRAWASFARKPETATSSVAERLGLPHGFFTEKGSSYTYNPDGSIHREKYDGTESDQSIAVFIEHTPENYEILTRMGASSDHLPPEYRKKAYILQITEKENGQRVADKIFSASEVTDPSKLAFALINGKQEVLGWIPASLQPVKGSHVFEMSRLPDGSTSRHPGHRVTDIFS